MPEVVFVLYLQRIHSYICNGFIRIFVAGHSYICSGALGYMQRGIRSGDYPLFPVFMEILNSLLFLRFGSFAKGIVSLRYPYSIPIGI